MITKQSFIKTIEAIESQFELDSKISDHLNALMPESTESVFSTKLADEVVKILEQEFEDQGDWISFYLYELDKEGGEAKAWHKNGDPIRLDSAGDLYDFLVENIAKA